MLTVHYKILVSFLIHIDTLYTTCLVCGQQDCMHVLLYNLALCTIHCISSDRHNISLVLCQIAVSQFGWQRRTCIKASVTFGTLWKEYRIKSTVCIT